VNQIVNLIDKLRVRLAAARYDVWLDLRGVPRKTRRDLRTELRSNLIAAAQAGGTGEAIKQVGSLRSLAAETTRDGQLRSRWSAGATAGAVAFAALLAFLFAASLYYVEGVLDAAPAEPVSGGLFPFVGSNVTVNDQGPAGFDVTVQPGPMLLILPLVVFILVAKPWRTTWPVLATRATPRT